MTKCKNCGTSQTPYYEEVKDSTVQDHASIFQDTKYASAIEFKEEFQVPAVDEDIQVKVKNVDDVVVGSYIWNPAYGYLKIAHWDSCTGKVGLLNEGLTGTAAPGSNVPKGTLFLAAPRPCCADQDNFSLFPFLAENFTVPAIGNSTTIQVTSTFGLIVGTYVRIGTGVYFLEQINSSLEVVIRNDGAGEPPGTVVQARDVNGDLQYLLTSEAASACTAIAADTGKLVICDGSNQVVLGGDFADQVPVLQDPLTGEAKYELLDTEVRVCTVLTTIFNIISTTQNYTIDVDDESIFSIGDILQINFQSTLRWEVTGSGVGTLDISCVGGVPGVNLSVIAGSAVCLQLSLETVENRLDAVISDGWVPLADQGIYVSTDILEIIGDVTEFLKIGQKLKLLLNGVEFYANVLGFGYETITPGRTAITIFENLDYILSNDPITFVEFSLGDPQDFPPYFEYDVNPTGFVGALTTEVGYYWVVGSEVRGKFILDGTSDNTATGADLPTDADATMLGLMKGQLYGIIDNGNVETTIGMALSSGTKTLSLYKTQAIATGWTAANQKSCLCEFSYIVEQ